MRSRSVFVRIIILVFLSFGKVCVKTQDLVFVQTGTDVFTTFQNEDISGAMPKFKQSYEGKSYQLDKLLQQPQEVHYLTNHYIRVNPSSEGVQSYQSQPKNIEHSIHPISFDDKTTPNMVDPSYPPKETLPYPFYPFQIVSAVRHKEIYRNRPTSSIPYVKERFRATKLNTFESKMLHDISHFDHDSDYAQLNVFARNSGGKSRMKREANSDGAKKQIHGNLLPVALTVVGENGEQLSGRNLLRHIAAIIKNAPISESIDEMNNYNKRDMFLNERDFLWIMKKSINLSDPIGLCAYCDPNDSSLLIDPHVNEYLNCIDASKTTNQFQLLQAKIECMKRKIFDNNNIFKLADSSRFSINNLPGTLVYADVMRNIEKSVRPNNGIGFYSLPMDELSHLKQIVLPIDDYISHIHYLQGPQSNYKNQQMHEDTRSVRLVFYVVKPDGRIYKVEEVPSHDAMVIFHRFPDIPHDEVYIEELSPETFVPMLYSD